MKGNERIKKEWERKISINCYNCTVHWNVFK